MKRITLLSILIILLCSSCNVKTTVHNSALPTSFASLEFWNGGTCMGSFNNVNMTVDIITTHKMFGNDISFYRYHVVSKAQSIDRYFIDSEATALSYTPQFTE